MKSGNEPQGEQLQNGDFIPSILTACPEFKLRWDEIVAMHKPDAPGPFAATLDLAHLIVNGISDGARRDWTSLFTVVDRLLRDGDEDVQEVVKIGLLEDLVSVSFDKPGVREVLVPQLLPRARASWEGLIGQWDPFLTSQGKPRPRA